MSLPVEEKSMFFHYCNVLEFFLDAGSSCKGNCCSGKTANDKSPARFLWTTAASAIPHREFSFAEKLLVKALEIATDEEDLAWIHLNLTQLYLDQQGENPDAYAKGTYHCQETMKTGYFTAWAKNLLQQFF